mmetsp:Transcript_20551/g.25196  ORF Transcript_20551/g.25196 Transcript_20551/m.25196 type:complete len:307 (-) Transcript_20551:297-1217(-)
MGSKTFFTVLLLFQGLYTTVAATEFELVEDDFYYDIDEISVSSGNFHTCAIELRLGIELGGPVKCWGYNDMGQSSPPPGTFLQVSSGHFHTCALGLNETASCWGKINYTPKGLFTQVSSGQHHSCGILKNRSIKCWGRDDFGESNSPAGSFVQVSSGMGFTCGLTATGLIKCWGKNSHKQSEPPQGIQFKQISVGTSAHACGITYDLDVICWGKNDRGQANNQKGPFIQVSTGAQTSCGIKEEDQSITCWGHMPAIPEDKMSRTNYDELSLGQDHMCVVDVDSELHCWYLGADLGGHVVPLGFIVG